MEDNQKTLKIFQKPNTALFYVGWDAGGVAPDELKGMYTSSQLAQKDIDRYLEKQSAKKAEEEKKSEYKNKRIKEIQDEQAA